MLLEFHSPPIIAEKNKIDFPVPGKRRPLVGLRAPFIAPSFPLQRRGSESMPSSLPLLRHNPERPLENK
jgi:hypothetical protein